MMMKRLLCLVICLMLAVPVAFGETADTLPKKFNRQLTGGNGVRGYMNITASGVAEWLTLLLPFTASEIQIRGIGEKQGEMSESVLDDDDWQVRFFVKNSDGEEVGTTWLYGDPQGVYFQSELLPDTLLSVPVEQVNLLYQLLRGEYDELFFAFDPMSMKEPGAKGNALAYEAVANLLGIPAETWETEWLPVLEKYFLQLDLWLAGYGDPGFVTGETGTLTMTATYQIPADELKAEAKYIIGQMLYDNDLQNLLLPYVTMEQRMTYLNPSMVYFYEACIDALPLNGDIILSREMSALGEIVSAKVSLPVPALPEKIASPIGEAAATLFELPYEDLLSGLERIEFTQNGTVKAITLTGEKRSVNIQANVNTPDAETTAMEGTVSILPAEGANEKAFKADFNCTVSHKIWADEKYLDHDTRAFSLAIEPAQDTLSDTSAEEYIDFKPVGIDWSVDYRNNPYQENSAVQINCALDAKLPDASIQVESVLRITPQLTMVVLSTDGAEDVSGLSDDQKSELLETFVSNAVLTMANLSGELVEAKASGPEATAEPEPTAVPPMTE